MKKLLLLLTVVAIPLLAYAQSTLVREYRGKMILGESGEITEVEVADATQLGLDVGTIAAAGSDDTDGTAIVDQITYVTGADGTKGVELPASTGSGKVYIVHNSDASNALKLYPDASGQINGGTATTGDVSVAAEETAIMLDVAENVWYGGVAVDF